jgi:hypothetical protein
MFDLSDYEDWCVAEARATHILDSMKIKFAMDLSSLPSTQAMWEHAKSLYQPSSHALDISTLEPASSIDAFYRQLIDVRRLLDSLTKTYCWVCDSIFA